MKVTVREVAKAANVSIGTVSRVLNGDASVSPENIATVRRTVSSLNYRPLRNRVRADHDQRLNGKTVGLLLLGMDRSLVSLPVVAAAIHGAEAAIARAGANVLLADVPNLDQFPAVLRRNSLDGVILKGALQGQLLNSLNASLLQELRSLPSVWILGKPDGCWGDVVAANDTMVGQMAAAYLISKGHRRLAFLNPKTDHITFRRREMSFMFSAQERGAQVQRFVGTQNHQWQLPLRATLDVNSVQQLVDDLLAATPRPTAVFTPGDSVAALVYRALLARQLQIGRDMSVMSCNNERTLNSGLYPSLTTIDTHAEKVGERAVDQLRWRLCHKHHEPAMEIAIAPMLVEGASVTNI